MLLAPRKPKITVFTKVFTKFFSLGSKNHGIYSIFWTVPSKNTGTYPVFIMFQEIFFSMHESQNPCKLITFNYSVGGLGGGPKMNSNLLNNQGWPPSPLLVESKSQGKPTGATFRDDAALSKTFKNHSNITPIGVAKSCGTYRCCFQNHGQGRSSSVGSIGSSGASGPRQDPEPWT